MMLGELFSQAKDAAANRFVSNAFLPSVLFWTALVAVWVQAAGDDVIAWTQAIFAREPISLTLTLVLFVGWCLLFAKVLDSQAQALLSFFAGEWRGTVLGGLGILFEMDVKARILPVQKEAGLEGSGPAPITWMLFRDYPLPPLGPRAREKPGLVWMPTRLGNILYTAVYYARTRYGIESDLMWPHLYQAAPEAYRAAYQAIRERLDFHLAFAALGLVFSALSWLILWRSAAPWETALAALGGLLVMLIFYSGALGPARALAGHMRMGYDLHRAELAKLLGLRNPTSNTEEEEMWKAVQGFLYRKLNLPDAYLAAPPAPNPKPASGLLPIPRRDPSRRDEP